MLEREKKELAAINQAIKLQSTTVSSTDEPLNNITVSKPIASAKQAINSKKQLRSQRSRAGSSSSCTTLQGIRPECEAVMRAIFCKLDRSGEALCIHYRYCVTAALSLLFYATGVAHTHKL
jgi:hypothetical protein